MFHAGLGKSGQPRRDREPAVFEGVHRNLESFALGAETIFLWNFEVLQEHRTGPQAVRQTRHGNRMRAVAASALRFDDEGADSGMTGRRIGLGEQQARIAGIGEGDPLFGAVQAVNIAMSARRGLHCARSVRAAARFGQRKHTDSPAGDQIRHEAFDLRIAAPVEDGVGASHGLLVQRVAKLGRQTRQLLRDCRYGEETGIGTAERLGKGGAKQSGLTHLADDGIREFAARLVRADHRLDLGFDDAPDRVGDGGILFG